MKIEIDKYEIEIFDNKQYTTKSADNLRKFKYEYNGGKLNDVRIYPTCQYGIIVKNIIKGVEISSAIICENGGATIIHEQSYFIEDGMIWICICNKIYCLNLPELSLIWFNQIDHATNFSIHPFKDDFIVHGELEVIRIKRNGEVVWSFGGRDIFVTEEEEEEEVFQIKKNLIEVVSWDGYMYTIDENGKELSNRKWL